MVHKWSCTTRCSTHLPCCRNSDSLWTRPCYSTPCHPTWQHRSSLQQPNTSLQHAALIPWQQLYLTPSTIGPLSWWQDTMATGLWNTFYYWSTLGEKLPSYNKHQFTECSTDTIWPWQQLYLTHSTIGPFSWWQGTMATFWNSFYYNSTLLSTRYHHNRFIELLLLLVNSLDEMACTIVPLNYPVLQFFFKIHQKIQFHKKEELVVAQLSQCNLSCIFLG